MTTIIILLASLVLVCAIVSGVVYARQQAITQRKTQTKHLKQKYQEFDRLYQFIMNIDENPEIAILLHNQLLDFAQQLHRLNKKSSEFQTLLNQLKTRAAALKKGRIVPKGIKTVSSDSSMRHHTAALKDISQRINRLKIRGQLPIGQYEKHIEQLKRLNFEVEYQSHMAFAEKLVKDEDLRNAVHHLKHARDALKKTRVDIDDKNKKIKEISERIQALERGKCQSSERSLVGKNEQFDVQASKTKEI